MRHSSNNVHEKLFVFSMRVPSFVVFWQEIGLQNWDAKKTPCTYKSPFSVNVLFVEIKWLLTN